MMNDDLHHHLHYIITHKAIMITCRQILVFLFFLLVVLCCAPDFLSASQLPDDHRPFVLVTGANGLIGSSLVQELLKRGHRVRGTVRDLTNPTKTATLQSFPNAATQLELVAFELKETDPKVYETLLEGGIEWVFHTAAVVEVKGYDGSEEARLIEEAIHAVQSLLAAAQATPSVTQFVFTSSASAISQGHANDPVKSSTSDIYVFNEDDWSNLEGPNVPSYAKIKTLSERAAWDFVEQQQSTNPDSMLSFRLTTLLPTIVLGKMTSSENLSSMRLIQRIMEAKDPGSINLFVALVDMQDVVEAHIRAASLPSHRNTTSSSYRRRFLLTQTDGGNAFLPEISTILREHFGPMGYRIRSWIIPKWILWIMSFFDPELAFIYGRIGRPLHYSTARSQEALDLTYRNATETLLDAAHDLIRFGLLPKTEAYQQAQDAATSRNTKSGGEL